MNTRVAVPLTQEAYDAVSFLAEIGGTSRGRFLAEIVEAAVPSLLTIQAAYKAAMAVEGEERAQLVAGMAEAEKRLMASLAQNIPQAVPGLGGAVPASSPQGEGAGAERPSDPPILTGGFTTSPNEDRGH